MVPGEAYRERIEQIFDQMPVKAANGLTPAELRRGPSTGNSSTTAAAPGASPGTVLSGYYVPVCARNFGPYQGNTRIEQWDAYGAPHEKFLISEGTGLSRCLLLSL